ncbi:MAG: hypothetical protein HY934_03015 [Candidatus Firestonebacteria bacterium]|nr:hypothetical protein [Candidatus Firestonebacteria bacterium]
MNLLPKNEWASIKHNKILACSRKAFLYLGYSKGLAQIPAQAFNMYRQ